jgi:hypothetical protein
MTDLPPGDKKRLEENEVKSKKCQLVEGVRVEDGGDWSKADHCVSVCRLEWGTMARGSGVWQYSDTS